MLKNTHQILKNYILSYFYAFELQCIPSTNCGLIDKGKHGIVPLMLSFAVYCSAWHLMVEMVDLKSLENVVELCLNVNITIGGAQTFITIWTLNKWFKSKLFQVLQFFDDIVDSDDEYMAPAREEYLDRSLSFAWKLVRLFLLTVSLGCLPLVIPGLLQTNFTEPLFYKIPGIPSESILFQPVNVIGQIFLLYLVVETIITMDCLLFIYLFYFRGELFAITSVAELLTDKVILEKQSEKILRTLYKAHREALNTFSVLYDVSWHFYGQKFFALSLYICSGFTIFSRINNSIIIGVILQSVVLSQLLFLCMPGQLTDNCSEKLRNTLYTIPWYEMKIEDQKNLLMLMIGAQKSIHAQTIGIGKISIYTFVQVLKTAISYAAFAYTALL